MKEEEEEDDNDREQREEEEEEGETGRFGRFLLRVKDCREKDGFTVTDMEIQVNTFTHCVPTHILLLVYFNGAHSPCGAILSTG